MPASAPLTESFLIQLLPATRAYSNRTFNFVSTFGSAGHGSEQAYLWYDPTATSTGVTTGRDAALNATQIERAIQAQKWLVSYVIEGNPNTLFAAPSSGEWPKYEVAQQVMQMADDGFSLVEDALDNNRTEWWNKVSRSAL